MQKIGRGLFSTVYRDGEDVIVKSSCWAKECNALFGYGDSELWPEIVQLEYGEVPTYRMPYYEQPKSLKTALLPDQYDLYKALKAHGDAFTFRFRESEYERYNRFFAHWEPFPFMQQAIEALSNYGNDMRFEISPRNVAVKDGKLILLDVWFFASQAFEIRTSRRKVRYN